MQPHDPVVAKKAGTHAPAKSQSEMVGPTVLAKYTIEKLSTKLADGLLQKVLPEDGSLHYGAWQRAGRD